MLLWRRERATGECQREWFADETEGNAMKRSTSWMAVTLAAMCAGCGSSDEKTLPLVGTVDPEDPGAAQNAAAGGGASRPSGFSEVATGQAAAALTRADSCDELLSRIHDDAIAKIEIQAELMREEPEDVYARGGGGIAIPAAAPPTDAAGVPGAATPMPGNAAPEPPRMAPQSDGDEAASESGAKGASAGPSDFSDTNVQVKGVDEADIVKTDGTHIYLLHGNQFFVLDAWPADMTELTGQLDVEGSALEMFVHEGTAVVFSSVYDQGDLIERELDEDAATGAKPAPFGSYYGGSFTKITLIDTKPETPVVLRELFIQGDYVSARRHGDTVRSVIRDGSRFPQLYGGYIEYRDPWGRAYSQQEIDAQVDDWRDRTIGAAQATELADWLPTERELEDGELTSPEPRCTDFYVPAAGLANGGVTNILSFDLTDADSELGGAIVMGAADEVYANDAVLVLAHRDWRWDQQLIERERTVLHRFEIDGAETKYTASGPVPGHIIDQFSIDEREGVIRIATTARFWPNFIPRLPEVAQAAEDDLDSDPASDQPDRQTDNRVITLDVDEDRLVRLGTTGPLGKDGETIQSTRFVDDKGYVVTFERIDPLIVVDLAEPERPSVLGQLDIPGFSEYMHPLDADHLLTIGQDADQQGRVLGLMLQIFDVSDAAEPIRTHSFRFGPNGYSEASQNHKAFTFHRPAGAEGYDGLLAFPYVSYSANFQSTLQVFEVSAAQGFRELGAIDHTGLLREVCRPFADPAAVDAGAFYPCVQPETRRGLFIFGDEGDFVYSISNGGVLAHELSDLSEAVASVPLPFPDYNDHRVFRGDGAAGVSAAVPAPSPPPTAPIPAPAPPRQPALPEPQDAGVADAGSM
jgi:hypothetical protein